MLQLLEGLAARQETQPKSYAYLHDRVAVAQGRPQRYGAQGRCTGPGTWEPAEVESPDELDARRASRGLPPESEYLARFSFCRAANPPRASPPRVAAPTGALAAHLQFPTIPARPGRD